MRIRLVIVLILAAAVTAYASAAIAQKPQTTLTGAAQKFVGETLRYEGKIDKILRGVTVAELTFSAEAVPGRPEIIIQSKAVSKGTLLKLFRFSFLQDYESLLDIDRFRILRTRKHDVQKQRVRDSEAVFNYQARIVTFVESDPKDAMRPPRKIASEISDQMYDMISAIYAVRLMPLAVGTRVELSVSDSGLVFRVPFVVAGREVQNTIFGKISTFRIEPEIFGPGRLIEQKGSMTIWMTEDDRHLPIRAQVQTDFGKANIKLKSYSKPLPR
ncbi:MAG: DUF3108 domain-containing protein [Pyrinomonadaceae bacterium]